MTAAVVSHMDCGTTGKEATTFSLKIRLFLRKNFIQTVHLFLKHKNKFKLHFILIKSTKIN
jgi:hypothetical protein